MKQSGGRRANAAGAKRAKGAGDTKATKASAKAGAKAGAKASAKAGAKAIAKAGAKATETEAVPDGGHDEVSPDAAPDALSLHAETLAGTVRARRSALAKAKVTAADADRLEALASALRAAESAWRAHWITGGTGTVAALRAEATRGRRDLFSALRTFAEHDADTQAQLDDIAGVEHDADLLQDLERLVALARKHAADLEGTDVDAARAGQIADAAEAFRAARAGAADARQGAEAEAHAERGSALWRARNRTYWALAELDRRVCARGRHLYREDPAALRAFAAHTASRAKRAKGR